jgi:hypothetical protein
MGEINKRKKERKSRPTILKDFDSLDLIHLN